MDQSTPTPRHAVAGALPTALGRALDNYETFAAAEPPGDAKEFTAFQSGCKAALAHVEALLKLVDQVTPPREDAETAADLAGERAVLHDLVREARTAVARLRTG
jgi:hypothetical protein